MRSRILIPTSVAAVAAVSVFAAGCGGGSPGSIAAATTPPQNVALAVVHCFRSHGVPNFPDPPRPGARAPKPTAQQLGVTDSQFQAAANTCRRLISNAGSGPQETAQQTRTRVVDALSFARCVRARGFPSFPDPTNQGQLTPQMVTAAGIDLHQPSVLSAGLACLPASHGLLTRASIERAINGG